MLGNGPSASFSLLAPKRLLALEAGKVDACTGSGMKLHASLASGATKAVTKLVALCRMPEMNEIVVFYALLPHS